MSERIKEIKSFIEGDLYNPYKGQSFKYEEYDENVFKVSNECWTLKVDVQFGDIEVTTNKGYSVGKYDCEWFMSIVDSMSQIQRIWDEYTDVE